MESHLIFWIATLLLEFGLVSWAAVILCSYGQRHKWLQSPLQPLRQIWEVLKDRNKVRTAEVDVVRCQFTRVLWKMNAGIYLLRVMVRQAQILLGKDRLLEEFDFQLILLTSVGLAIVFKPNLITANTLDLWYVATSLLSTASLLPAQNMDPRDLGMSFRAEFLFALLTKNPCSVVLCTLVHVLHAIALTYTNSLQDGGCHLGTAASKAGQQAVMTQLLSLASILLLRQLVLDNITLKLDLKTRTVELGAVSSLLLVCYDAVVQLDECFNLVDDSSQLSSMLLHTSRHRGFTGKSFLDYFVQQDQERIHKLFCSEAPVMTLNAEMVDADQNHLKVELVYAQFRDLSEERRLLIGVKELQDRSEPVAPLPSEPSPLNDTFYVSFEVPSFDILSMSPGLQESLSGTPESVLDIASQESRESFCGQLQHLVNELVAGRQATNGLSFKLQGQGEVYSRLQLEEDTILGTWVGSLRILGADKRLREGRKKRSSSSRKSVSLRL